jgi:methylation protein EvaC
VRQCRICGGDFGPFIDFGKMPLANGFLTAEQLAAEYFYDLQVGFCEHCGMVQLLEQPSPTQMFHQNYAFFSTTSTKMAAHFKEFAEDIKSHHLISANPFVVEIGSNDGIMLQHFAKAGVRHLGVEPSANVAQAASQNGVHTICNFFDEKLACELVEENGRADVVLAANVMCHIPSMHSVVKGIKTLLKKDGVLVFEDPYLADIIDKTSYDQIYDEHVFLFSISSLLYLFNIYDMEIIDVEPQETHGGSMRYIVANSGVYKSSKRVIDYLAKEKILHNGEIYEQFRGYCEYSKTALIEILTKAREQGKRVVGYGATSKSTTVINYCGITPELVEYISDTTPIKHGKYSPGAHIPIRPYEDFVANYPDYALLFAWNHSEEITAKEQRFRDADGQWIVYIPSVRVIA